MTAQEQAQLFLAELLGIEEINPSMEKRSVMRVLQVQRRLLEDTEILAQIVCLKVGSSWARVDDSNGAIVYEGTYDGAVAWLRDRGVCALSAGSTHQERLANRK